MRYAGVYRRLERVFVPVPAVPAVRRGPPVERLEPPDRHERRGRVDPVQALRLAARVVVTVVVELVLLGPQVAVHAPAAAGNVVQYGRETGPVPGVHPAVDQRVVARVRHGQPVEQEPYVRQAAPRAQRRFVVPQYLRNIIINVLYYVIAVVKNTIKKYLKYTIQIQRKRIWNMIHIKRIASILIFEKLKVRRLTE